VVTVRAIGITRFGGPEVLHEVQLPQPRTGPGELRIRVRAAGVNPTDTLLRSGARAHQLRDVAPPYVPGMDAAGVLEEVGEGVTTGLSVGDHVMAVVVPQGSHGGYSEQIVVPAESVVRVPEGATDAEAASLPMNALTARLALDVLGLDPGATLAVTGAAGAVGGYTIQLAKADGLRVIADASPGDRRLVEALGADEVVERGEAFADAVRASAPGGTDGLVDAALLDAGALGAVGDGGRIVTLRGYRGPEVRDITWHPVFVREYGRQQAKLDRLREQVNEGRLALRVAETLGAEEAARAHSLLEAGGVRGRLILEF
jgi:NADPH:quinone reductase-like Zn-dependent oxidoreductase